MLRKLIGATLTAAFVASALQWSTPEATARAARHQPWISDALWYGWLACAGTFLAVVLVGCPTVVLLRRRGAALRPLIALTLSLSIVTTYVIATSDGEVSRHLWLIPTVGLVWVVSVVGFLLTVCVLTPVLFIRRSSRPPVEQAAGWRLDPMTGRQVYR